MSAPARAVVLGGTLVTGGAFLVACRSVGSLSVLEPHGAQAARVAVLWWLMFTLALVAFVGVAALLGLAVVRAWRRRTEDDTPTDRRSMPIVAGGVGVTALIVSVVFAASLWTSRSLADPDEPPSLTVEVVGHQWWWEVRYPEANAATANEIHVPVGESVWVRLTSNDVIHSFWVPELAGKLDLVPGRTNELRIEADEPGVYRGRCAEFCGAQHAHMAFLVVAEPREDFDAWLARQREPAPAPTNPLVERGQEVFLTAGCAACHAVRGTPAEGRAGPDLTHLAGRRTIAAGTQENNLANLSGWVADPQGIKPGNRMPSLPLDAEELRAVVAYLLTLE